MVDTILLISGQPYQMNGMHYCQNYFEFINLLFRSSSSFSFCYFFSSLMKSDMVSDSGPYWPLGNTKIKNVLCQAAH